MNAIASETTWLTYEDGGRLLGIKPDSLKRRAAARKWPRRMGNDGRAQVGIPTHLIPPDVTPDAPPAHIPARTPDDPEQPERAGASSLALELAAERARTERLSGEVADLRADLAQAQERLANTTAHLTERLVLAQAERDREVAQLREHMAEIREDRDTWRAQATAPRAGFLERLWLSLRAARAG